MVRLYEFFEVTKDIVAGLETDIGLSLDPEAKGKVADTLMSIVNEPRIFQMAFIGGKPGFCFRIGQIQTRGFAGQGLHMFTHPSPEGVLDLLTFDSRLRFSLERRRIPFEVLY